MELHEIRYFLALAEALNFTRAAEACDVSQPTLTRAIGKMEDELGGLLFSRERSNTHLTDLGRLVEPHLSDAMNSIGEAKRAAERLLKLEQAHLTIGVMYTIAPLRLVNVLSRFRSEHKGVEVGFLEASAQRLCDMLFKGELDVAIMARPGAYPPALNSVELYREPYGIACSRGHRFASQNEVSVADLDGEPYFRRPDCEFEDALEEICAAKGVRLKKSAGSDQETWNLTMVAAGFGICLVPHYAGLHPDVVYRSLSASPLTRAVSLVTVAGRRWSPTVAAFVRAVRGQPWSSFLGDPGVSRMLSCPPGSGRQRVEARREMAS